MNEIHTAPKILATYPAPEGLAWIVAQITGGYSVSLKATEADEMVGVNRIYKTEEAAHLYARIQAAR